MIRNKEITAEENQLQVLQVITSVYSQVASLWMMRTRDSVLKSRDFLEEIYKVFVTVFASYSREVQSLAKRHQRRDGKITFISHNGKKVGVFLSANSGFYGEIINKTFQLFIKDVRENNLEVTIVGRQGLALFKSEEPNHPYTFFDFQDEHVDQSKIVELVRHLVQYEEIRVYYGKFQNFLAQNPVMFKMSADPFANMTVQETTKRYIFEPDLESILVFFEKEVFTSIFEQTVRESQLAKFASRIMVMDRASENIKGRLKTIKTQQLRLTHRLSNQKQLSRMSSMSLWNA